MSHSEVKMTPEAIWKNLRDDGRKLLIDLSTNDLIDDKPSWFDEDRFKKAKAAINKYYIGVQYSSFTGLLLILQLPDGLEPLLSTGNSKDIPSLYKRYLNTILHVMSWYEDDVFNPETKGYKSIRQVRSMHKRVQNIMNEKFKVCDVDGNDRVWLSQYDVAMTQFAFIGLAMLFPQKTCMISAKNEDLELINYYWRVLGYLMGIKDEFNPCQFDKYEDIKELNRLIFQHEYKDNFNKMPCKKGLEMTKSICLALQYFMPLITFNSLAHWWSDCFLFNGYEPQPMDTKDTILIYWTKLSFNHLLKYEGFLNFSNRLHVKRLQKRLKNQEKVYEKLKTQYKENTDHTYYSDRVDYFGACDNQKNNLNADYYDASKLHNDNENKLEDDEFNNNNTKDELLECSLKNNSCPLGYSSVSTVVNGEPKAVLAQ